VGGGAACTSWFGSPVARGDQPLAPAFPTPALRKEREGRGTHFVADASEIKSLGHPPRKIAAITLKIWKKGERFDAEHLKLQAA
jgi:hypothetical protein